MSGPSARRTGVVVGGAGPVDRAYVAELAGGLGLTGFVGADGRCAEVEGEPGAVAEFVETVLHAAGGGLTGEDVPPLGGAEFAVLVAAGARPDAALAPDAGCARPAARSCPAGRPPLPAPVRGVRALRAIHAAARPRAGRAGRAPFSRCARRAGRSTATPAAPVRRPRRQLPGARRSSRRAGRSSPGSSCGPPSGC